MPGIEGHRQPRAHGEEPPKPSGPAGSPLSALPPRALGDSARPGPSARPGAILPDPPPAPPQPPRPVPLGSSLSSSPEAAPPPSFSGLRPSSGAMVGTGAPPPPPPLCSTSLWSSDRPGSPAAAEHTAGRGHGQAVWAHPARDPIRVPGTRAALPMSRIRPPHNEDRGCFFPSASTRAQDPPPGAVPRCPGPTPHTCPEPPTRVRRWGRVAQNQDRRRVTLTPDPPHACPAPRRSCPGPGTRCPYP